MCCSIQKTNDQRKKFFFRPKNFPSFRLILRFSVSADMKKVCIRLRSAAGKEDARLSSLPTWSGRKKPDFPACRRGREGRNSTFQLADAVGKEETRLSGLPTWSGRKKFDFLACRRRREAGKCKRRFGRSRMEISVF